MPAPDLSVFDRIRTKADFDRAEEEFQLKRMALQQAKAGNLPAALKIADRLTQLRASEDPGAKQQIDDILAAQKILRFDPGIYAQGGQAMEYPGYGDVKSAIGGQVAGTEEEARQRQRSFYEPAREQDIAERKSRTSLQYDPLVEAAKEREKTKSSQQIADLRALPLTQEIRGLNEQTLDLPYSGATRGIARLVPNDRVAQHAAALDLMQQARIELAAPLAKQLGVNPTDKDFQASLDRIFDINASRASRAAQIDSLERRILSRQGADIPPIDYEALTSPDYGRKEARTTPPPAPLNLQNIPMSAVKELRADPSPQAKAEFDQIFGQGASRMVLSNGK